MPGRLTGMGVTPCDSSAAVGSLKELSSCPCTSTPSLHCCCRELTTKNLGNAVNTADVIAEGKPLMFGDFLKFGADREDKVYEEVTCAARPPA